MQFYYALFITIHLCKLIMTETHRTVCEVGKKLNDFSQEVPKGFP